MNEKNNRDSFDENYDDNYDDYDYENYGEYDDSFSLTGDDEMPLTSDRDGFDDDFSDEPNPRQNRTPSRRETINRLASEQRNGRKGLTYGHLSNIPDPRLTSGGKRSRSSYSSRGRAATSGGYKNTVRTQPAARPGRSEKTENNTQRNKKRKSRFAAFYIVFALLAVGSGLTLLLMFSMQWMENPMAFGSQPVPAPTPVPAAPVLRPEMRSQTALVTAVSSQGANRTMSLMDVSTRREDVFNVDEGARVSNRLGNVMTFSEIQVGHLIDIQFEVATNTIRAIDESRSAWERRNRNNVHINMENGTITLGNEVFTFNSQTIVLYRGEVFPLIQIRPVDSVTLVGIGETAWLVRLDASHGFLNLANTDMITNGTIMIGTNLFYTLDDITEPITLTEGVHRIVVEGNNIETFIENITIEQGRTTVVNLGTAVLRQALLHIMVLPNDAEVTVNGEPHDISQPAEVYFGEVHIRVERNGFMPQEETLNVQMPISQITFELEEILLDSTIIIWSMPTNAEVYVENVFIGFTTLTHTVPPGTHNITIRMTGFDNVYYTITAPAGEEVVRSFLLDPIIRDPLDGLDQPFFEPIPPVSPGGGSPELPTLPDDNPFPDDDGD